MSTVSPAQDQPLVSIICRSVGRPELSAALDSITQQDWPHIEVVLIDAAAKGLADVVERYPALSIQLVSSGRRYSRSEAANAGLATAGGFYVMFLDDDDWIAPAHVASLVACLQTNPEFKAAYSSTQKTNRHGEPLEYVFAEDFDAELLMRDNYIPIHAMLFERSLLAHGCQFDESFDIYEDWDFWLQLSRHTEFMHLNQITAFYREGGESETAASDVGERYLPTTLLGKARAAVFDKWRQQWNGQQLNRLIGSMDQSGQLSSLAAELHELRVALEANLAAQESLRGEKSQLHAELADARRHIEDRESQLADRDRLIQEQADQIVSKDGLLEENAAAIRQLQNQVADEQHEIANLEAHIQVLTQTLDSVYASLSWRLMGPFRRAYRSIKTRADSLKSRNDK